MNVEGCPRATREMASPSLSLASGQRVAQEQSKGRFTEPALFFCRTHNP